MVASGTSSQQAPKPNAIPETEALVDRFFYTPLGNITVRLLYPTRIRPNQVSLGSMLAGIAAGVCYGVGSWSWLFAGGLLLIFATVLDAADGALARARKQASEIGKLFDNNADSVKGGSIMIGLTVGMLRHGSWGPDWLLSCVPISARIWAIGWFTGFSIIVQVLGRNWYISEWDRYACGKDSSAYPDRARVRSELAGLVAQGGHYLERLFVAVLLPLAKAAPPPPSEPPPPPNAHYRQRLFKYMRLWTLYNGAAQLTAVALGSMLNAPAWGMLAVTVAGNALCLPLYLLTRRVHAAALRGQ